MASAEMKCDVSPSSVVLPSRFTVGEFLGSGSFSNVFTAYDKATNKTLAIKYFKFRAHCHSNHKYAAREIAFLKILWHPNIVRLEDYGIQKDHMYLGVEYSPHNSLRKYLSKTYPARVPEAIVQAIMQQLCSALAYLHDLSIYHGDVKPDNILVTKHVGPEIKLSDFGLTAVYLKDQQFMCNKAGSYFYMAPELHLGFPFNTSCDLYSAGVVMYELMYHSKPLKVRCNNRNQWIAALRARKPLSFPEDPDFHYSVECLDLVKGLLSYDKQNRPSGLALTSHPFLNVPSVPPFVHNFYSDGCKSIVIAISEGERKDYGNALIDATQAKICLKLHYNRLPDPSLRNYCRQKWEEYGRFRDMMEHNLKCPEQANDKSYFVSHDDKLRNMLTPTPALADAFELACAGEMYLKQGDSENGFKLLSKAVDRMLTNLKDEPDGRRKNALGHRIARWIHFLEKNQPENCANKKKSFCANFFHD